MLRPLLAMRWIELGKGVPPMRFDLLMDGVIADQALRDELEGLVAAKRLGCEQDDFAPPPLTAALLGQELSRLENEPPVLATGQEKADLDALFKAVLADAWQGKLRGEALWRL